MDASTGKEPGPLRPDGRKHTKHLTFAEKLEKFDAQAEVSEHDNLQKNKPQFSLLNNLIIENTTKKVLEAKNIRMNQIHHKKEAKNELTNNFFFHGEQFAFAKKSLYLFSESNAFRRKCVWLSTHR